MAGVLCKVEDVPPEENKDVIVIPDREDDVSTWQNGQLTCMYMHVYLCTCVGRRVTHLAACSPVYIPPT